MEVTLLSAGNEFTSVLEDPKLESPHCSNVPAEFNASILYKVVLILVTLLKFMELDCRPVTSSTLKI